MTLRDKSYTTGRTGTARSAPVSLTSGVRMCALAALAVTVGVRTVVYDLSRKAIAQSSSPARATSNTTTEITQEPSIASPTLWSLERPYLYQAVTRVCSAGGCDEYTTPFGVRTFTFDREKGFFLN